MLSGHLRGHPKLKKRGELLATLLLMSESLQNQNASGRTPGSGTSEHPAIVASHFFPSISALLRSLDTCPRCFDQWVGRCPERVGRWKERIRQWKLDGCPEIEWPEASLVVRDQSEAHQ
jgi:hypothetical protein